MKRGLVMLLSCVMAFTLVITVSASSGTNSGGVKKEYFIDLTSHNNDEDSNSEAAVKDEKDGKDRKDVKVGIESKDSNVVKDIKDSKDTNDCKAAESKEKKASNGNSGSDIQTVADASVSMEAEQGAKPGTGFGTGADPDSDASSLPEVNGAGAAGGSNAAGNNSGQPKENGQSGDDEDSQASKTQDAAETQKDMKAAEAAKDKEPVNVQVSHRFDLASPSLFGSLFLVNRANSLNNKFIPQGLEQVTYQTSGVTIASGRGSAMLNRNALLALNNMNKAAMAAGIGDMVFSSGYRDFSKQNSLYNRKVNTLVRRLGRKAAEAAAATVVAPAGSSEHQTGFAMDITTRQMLKRSDPLVDEFADTACGKWMSAHSWEFGYVLRYQYNKMQVTGIVYEPWHFRFVGKPHAEIMYKNGFCLEEYVRFLKSKSRLSFTDASGDMYEIAYVCPPAGTSVLNIAADKGSSVEVSKIDYYGYAVTLRKQKTEDANEIR